MTTLAKHDQPNSAQNRGSIVNDVLLLSLSDFGFKFIKIFDNLLVGEFKRVRHTQTVYRRTRTVFCGFLYGTEYNVNLPRKHGKLEQFYFEKTGGVKN